MFAVDIIAYLACRMSGRSRSAMIKEAHDAVAILSKYGIKCISPVLEEQIEDKPGPLIPFSEDELRAEWLKDKEFVKKCHVVIDLSAASPIRSEGATTEYLYARFALFKPIVRLFPKGLGPSITRFENAVIVQTLDEAGVEILTRWGSRAQRIAWRVRERIFWKWLKLLRLQFLGFFR
jgi:hypothetical protein